MFRQIYFNSWYGVYIWFWLGLVQRTSNWCFGLSFRRASLGIPDRRGVLSACKASSPNRSCSFRLGCKSNGWCCTMWTYEQDECTKCCYGVCSEHDPCELKQLYCSLGMQTPFIILILIFWRLFLLKFPVLIKSQNAVFWVLSMFKGICSKKLFYLHLPKKLLYEFNLYSSWIPLCF